MFRFIQDRIQKELTHFKRLPINARNLLLSYSLFEVVYPILVTFFNAFIWRNSQGFLSVAVYHISRFVSLPVGFYLNGKLLRYFKISKLYFIGVLFIGLHTLSVILSKGNSYLYYVAFGLVYGLGGGLFWSNRNFLKLRETKDSNRNYFSSIESSITTLVGIIIPSLTGWFIVFGENKNIYSTDTSYRILAISVLLILASSGLVLLRRKYETPSVNRVIIKKGSKNWLSVRLIQISIGLTNGVLFFVPDLLILEGVGNEKVLGFISSLVAIGTALLIYLFGRLSSSKHRISTFSCSIVLNIFASLLLLVFPEPGGYILYISLVYVSKAFIWVSAVPLIMSIIESEKMLDNYRYILDMELFLNTGRVIGIGAFLFLLLYFEQVNAIVSIPLISAVFQGIIFVVAISILKKNKFKSI